MSDIGVDEGYVKPAALKKVHWRRNGVSLNRTLRMLKMVRPICSECNDGSYGWWENCPHDPYFHTTISEVQEPELGPEDQFGKREVLGVKVSRVQSREPNTTQVSLDETVNSGEGHLMAQARGYRLLEDIGYAPMCEYLNCWSSDIKVHGPYGGYCSEDEAKMVKLRMLETAIPIDASPRRELLSRTPL